MKARVVGLMVAGLAALCGSPTVGGAQAAGPAAAPAPASAATGTARQLEIVPSLAGQKAAPVPSERALTAYLLVYFRDETHSLHIAVSRDGYSFTDVNGGQPVLSGRGIAEQQGIRDPHIVRGPDGAFYLSMTDLHIYAQREGLRHTEWERPKATHGWGNNRSLIFMKSRDLVHWTHAIVHVDRLFPETANLSAAWAPETIYDPKARKMMVYYTTRNGAGTEHMVYSYADDAFTTLTRPPQALFAYPRPNVGSIDGDITRIGGKFHLFYVAHERPGHLRQAVSDRINGGYAFDPTPVDPETVGTEAPNLWRRAGTNKYVLMYDVFGAKPNNMGFSETSDFKHFRNLGRFNEPGSPMKATNFAGPKHGAVMPITPAEAERLERHFAAP
ncbi:glycoside hydrolase family 43 protein [Novosphingobium clariflavum]|uniref:Glycoside hydrolase family 43 protein n=1 Tax=Novosphingobium clariflavum TaxID=2029884 RepID=A0ABV6SDP2_9SPHN|nr:glycoside hydrolase family 43 protein [Novosphingobium clariflavum]